MNRSAKERIENITNLWFLEKPIYFSVYCTHQMIENNKNHVPLRTGLRRIEYSPNIIDLLDDKLLEELLEVEIIRILLKHPYQRQPLFAKRDVLTLASNYTINSFSLFTYPIYGTNKFDLPENLCFEEYYSLIDKLLNKSNIDNKASKNIEKAPNNETDSDNQTDSDNKQNKLKNNKDIDNSSSAEYKKLMHQNEIGIETSELWEENESLQEEINSLIEFAETANTWGTTSQQIREGILASLKVKIDYRKMLSFYRTSILSSKRNLTRMKPNRRYGFDAMGSKYALKSNLLVAVDVSGSISTNSLEYFYSIINRFFKYGIETIDVLQFDYEITQEAESLKKAKQYIQVTGRGGTCFQPAVDYCISKKIYDGLIYFTDGYAPFPNLTGLNIEILWVLNCYENYNHFIQENGKRKNNRVTYIPIPEC